MFIQRVTWMAKPGCLDETIALVKHEVEVSHAVGRVIVPVHGQYDLAVMELRFESLAEYGTFWEGWSNYPGAAVFSQNFDPLAAIGGSIELWKVALTTDNPWSGKAIIRRRFLVQPGKGNELLKHMDAYREGAPKGEIIVPEFGPSDCVEMDTSFDSLEDGQKAWDAWFASADAEPFFQKWNTLVVSGGTESLWEVR